jgi:hypothetical protein
MLACNLANFMRLLALPTEIEHWPLTTLPKKLVKIGAKVTRRGASHPTSPARAAFSGPEPG